MSWTTTWRTGDPVPPELERSTTPVVTKPERKNPTMHDVPPFPPTSWSHWDGLVMNGWVTVPHPATEAPQSWNAPTALK